MIDDDIQACLDAPPDRSLAGLEAAVWRGVAARAAADRKLLALGALQGGALVAALLVSLSWGATRAAAERGSAQIGAFSPSMALAPSTRLIGDDR